MQCIDITKEALLSPAAMASNEPRKGLVQSSIENWMPPKEQILSKGKQGSQIPVSIKSRSCFPYHS